MAQAVVLEHRLEDGSWHYDWMVEDATALEERRLVTWRVDARPDRAEVFRGVRIGNHRAAYLDFEGDLGGGRGTVRRLARGRVCSLGLTVGVVGAVVAWENGPPRRYQGVSRTAGGWSFRVLPG